MSDFQISLIENSDIKASASVLSIAMLDNPLHMAVFQGNGENQRLEIERMFYELLLQLPGIVFLAKKDRQIIGVMRMKSCTGRKIGDVPEIVADESSIPGRKALWHREWAANDPLEQHWHLGPIGVLPGHRKMGVGSSLMRRFCSEVDACGAKAYLETDLDENVRFYKKFGFEVISRSTIFQVENRYMLRTPQA